jgi:hypothetical protein
MVPGVTSGVNSTHRWIFLEAKAEMSYKRRPVSGVKKDANKWCHPERSEGSSHDTGKGRLFTVKSGILIAAGQDSSSLRSSE